MELITPNEIERAVPEAKALAGHRFLIKYGGAAMEDEGTKELVF